MFCPIHGTKLDMEAMGQVVEKYKKVEPKTPEIVEAVEAGETRPNPGVEGEFSDCDCGKIGKCVKKCGRRRPVLDAEDVHNQVLVREADAMDWCFCGDSEREEQG